MHPPAQPTGSRRQRPASTSTLRRRTPRTRQHRTMPLPGPPALPRPARPPAAMRPARAGASRGGRLRPTSLMAGGRSSRMARTHPRASSGAQTQTREPAMQRPALAPLQAAAPSATVAPRAAPPHPAARRCSRGSRRQRMAAGAAGVLRPPSRPTSGTMLGTQSRRWRASLGGWACAGPPRPGCPPPASLPAPLAQRTHCRWMGGWEPPSCAACRWTAALLHPRLPASVLSCARSAACPDACRACWRRRRRWRGSSWR